LLGKLTHVHSTFALGDLSGNLLDLLMIGHVACHRVAFTATCCALGIQGIGCGSIWFTAEYVDSCPVLNKTSGDHQADALRSA
jgi:hypothetical protein